MKTFIDNMINDYKVRTTDSHKKNFPKLPLTIVCVVHNIRILSNSESHLNRPNGERSRGKSFI